MSIQLNNYKIQVFQGINDNPVEPVSTKAGNGSHLIAQYNQLINTLESTLNNATQWVVIIGNHEAASGQRILCNTSAGTPLQVELPSNPTVGDFVEILNLNGTVEVIVVFGNNPYKGAFVYDATFNDSENSATLIYLDAVNGWIPSRQNTFVPRTAG